MLRLIDDAPGYNSVRTILDILEKKNHVQHRRDGARFIYRPKEPAERTGPGLLNRLVRTFFRRVATVSGR